MSCESLRSRWETFIDGELPAQETLELQAHLDGCSECSEQVAFNQAMRRSACQLATEDAVITDAFRARLSHALLAEAQREHEEDSGARPRQLLRAAPRWGLAAIGTAAAVALMLRSEGASRLTKEAPLHEDGAPAERQAAMLDPEELLDLFIDYHTTPPKPQVTEPKLVPELERDVGVRVPLLSLAEYGAEWQSGSVMRVPRRPPAAYLRYRTADSHSVTVYVYNASRSPLPAGLRPRLLREEPVYEGSRRGYSIAAQLRQGVGYAVATDLNEARSAELVRAITTSAVSH